MNAALAVIDRVGVDELTIRSVAKLVGAPPMSLYTHFTNKNELIDLVQAEIARRLYGDVPPTRWQDDLFELCMHIRRLLTEHPRWIPLLARPAAPTASALRERLLRQMVDDGMSPADAMAALTSATTTAIGLVLLDATLREPDGQAAMSNRYERLQAWSETPSSDEHPVTKSALSKLPRLDAENNFAISIRALIRGLEVKRDA